MPCCAGPKAAQAGDQLEGRHLRVLTAALKGSASLHRLCVNGAAHLLHSTFRVTVFHGDVFGVLLTPPGNVAMGEEGNAAVVELVADTPSLLSVGVERAVCVVTCWSLPILSPPPFTTTTPPPPPCCRVWTDDPVRPGVGSVSGDGPSAAATAIQRYPRACV